MPVGACSPCIPSRPARALVSPARLADWMITFQFDGVVDFFELDPVAYAPALGASGMARYRGRLADIAAELGPRPAEDATTRWSSPDSHTRFTLDWNEQRLAVLDRDVAEVIWTHARDQRVAAWLEDTARALAEIEQIDLAIEWAQRATDFDDGHQSVHAAKYWCELLATHRRSELLAARLAVFRRWPTSSHANALRTAAGSAWGEHTDEVMTTLSARPREAVSFALYTLRDVPLAWEVAHSLTLEDDRLWADLAKAYEKLDPLAVLPVLTLLTLGELEVADAKRYRYAARRLARMRGLAAGTDKAVEVDALIAELRETHRRRTRLQQEFDRACLP
ncbi:MAG: hypothetical protein L0H79_01060 [Intrasporangium sp.]|uniref:hypothetical protein n=1 Tax=Intrasporangium sp. TaxID=1925024 RepID=UPI00264822BA|nr:hypothetical protein [Intrasporangium sp.]MDN5794323.1 hypothetical protein [Intrasporangium sp.]